MAWSRGFIAPGIVCCEDTPRADLGQLNARVGGRSPGLVPDRSAPRG
jgi:hypothetical protein